MAKKQDVQVRVNPALQANITPIGLEFERNQLMLGENYCRIYSIIRYPSECDYGWLAKLTNIPGTIVSINYTPLDNGTLMSTMSKNITLNRGQELAAKDPLERQRSKKAADDAEKIMRQMDQLGEVIGAWNTVIMVLSRDKNDFHDRCTRVESIANTLGCKVRILSDLQKEGYQQLSPTYTQNKQISEIADRPFPVSTFVGGFPFASGSFNDGNGYYLGKDSDGGIIMLDLWKRDEKRTNSNITVVGTSGTGKSTAIKHIISSEYARGTKIIIIDPEGEYKDLCRNPLINGDWIDVAGGSGGLINPLQIRPAAAEDEDADDTKKDLTIHLKTLETFFQLYIPSMDDRLRALLNKSLVELYAKFGITWGTDAAKFRNSDYPVMSDLYDLIAERARDNSRSAEYYETLLTYLESAVNGADHGMWNGHTTINPRTGFVVLDTKSLVQMSGTVLAAQYFNVLSWCWEQITRDRTERIMLVADECWTMIDPRVPQALEFMRNAEKRVRKYEGSIVVGTQSINDFLDPSIKLCGQAVLDLPTYKLLFGVDGQSLIETKEIFNLNDAQYDLIASKQRGVALMKIGAQAVKVRFALSEERLAMFGKGGGR